MPTTHPTYDCIVIGVGGFGSGAVDHLARRGARVLGIDRFDVAHDCGSSHGETRIVRKAYFEHPDYVPLLHRAYELWADLETAHTKPLWNLCGLMLAGPSDGEAIPGAKLAAEQHGLEIEKLSPSDAASRFPGFRIDEKMAAVFEPQAGFLYVEECVRAHVARAMRNGATINTGETVQGWQSDGRTVRVQTDRDEYSAGQLVITAGAWAASLLAELRIPLEVLRKPLFWHAVNGSNQNLDTGCPGFYFERPDGVFYGFPSLDGSEMKVAQHTGGETVTDPLHVNRDVTAADTGPVSRFVRECLPGVNPVPVRHSICMYTMTPDQHFLVDRHPNYENVTVAAGFSGHGFKFTSVIGEALADLALNGQTGLPIDFLSLDRAALR